MEPKGKEEKSDETVLTRCSKKNLECLGSNR